MKVFRNFLVAALLMISLVALANDSTTRAHLFDNEPTLKVFALKDNQFKVFCQSELQQNIRLRIIDRFGVKLYEEEFHATREFAKLFNLYSLPKGTYYLELTGEGWSKKEKLELISWNSSGLQAQLESLEGEDKVRLSVADSEIKKLNVTIEDGFDRILFQDEVELNKDGSRVFSFARKPSSRYVFRISTETQTQTKVVHLTR